MFQRDGIHFSKERARRIIFPRAPGHLFAAVLYTSLSTTIRVAVAMLGAIMGGSGRVPGTMLCTGLILAIDSTMGSALMVISLASFAMRCAVMLSNGVLDAL